jgi:Papain family cysteine protease
VDYAVTVEEYYTVIGETSMTDYVLSTGPLSICVDASDWATYQSGIVATCGTDVDHCVQVVGVDTVKGYWKVRNTWGTTWGDEGYIYLKWGQNTCAIANDPTYVKVAKATPATTVTGTTTTTTTTTDKTGRTKKTDKTDKSDKTDATTDADAEASSEESSTSTTETTEKKSKSSSKSSKKSSKSKSS